MLGLLIQLFSSGTWLLGSVSVCFDSLIIPHSFSSQLLATLGAGAFTRWSIGATLWALFMPLSEL